MPLFLDGSGLRVCRKLGLASAFLWLLAGSGCYHVRVIVPQPDPGTEYKKQTVQNLAWGKLPKKKDLQAGNCLNSTALDEVRTSSNLGYSFLTVGTLGFWSPSQVEWRCSKPREKSDGGTIKPKPKPISHVLTVAPQADGAQLSGRETIHTLAWGLVVKNAVAHNCANSKAMDEVRVSSNLGYHFLTVASVGFWSPTTVEWKCSRFQQQSGMANPNPPLLNQARLDVK